MWQNFLIWATRMNSLPKAGWKSRWKWSRPSLGQAALPKKLSGCLETSIPRVTPWKFHHWTSPFLRERLLEPFLTAVVEDPSNPTGLFGCWCHPIHPQTPNLSPKDPHHNSPSCAEGFFTETKQTQDFCEEAPARPKPGSDSFSGSKKKFG